MFAPGVAVGFAALPGRCTITLAMTRRRPGGRAPDRALSYSANHFKVGRQ
jgi:hypothetical protein